MSKLFSDRKIHEKTIFDLVSYMRQFSRMDQARFVETKFSKMDQVKFVEDSL